MKGLYLFTWVVHHIIRNICMESPLIEFLKFCLHGLFVHELLITKMKHTVRYTQVKPRVVLTEVKQTMTAVG